MKKRLNAGKGRRRYAKKTAALSVMAAIISFMGIAKDVKPDAARKKGTRAAYEKLYRVKIAAVIDGDTVDVNFLIDTPPDCTSEKQRVRLIGVDTPEYYKEEKQPYAEEAKGYTNRHWGENMVLRLDPATSYKDKYGRLLAYLYTTEGFMLNYELIRAGYGKYYDKFEFNKANMMSFKMAQEYAQKNKLGLWGLKTKKLISIIPYRKSTPAAAHAVHRKAGAGYAVKNTVFPLSRTEKTDAWDWDR